jgi:hypothetical protein
MGVNFRMFLTLVYIPNEVIRKTNELSDGHDGILIILDEYFKFTNTIVDAYKKFKYKDVKFIELYPIGVSYKGKLTEHENCVFIDGFTEFSKSFPDTVFRIYMLLNDEGSLKIVDFSNGHGNVFSHTYHPEIEIENHKSFDVYITPKLMSYNLENDITSLFTNDDLNEESINIFDKSYIPQRLPYINHVSIPMFFSFFSSHGIDFHKLMCFLFDMIEIPDHEFCKSDYDSDYNGLMSFKPCDISHTPFGQWNVFFSHFNEMDVQFIQSPYISIYGFDSVSNFIDFMNDNCSSTHYITIMFAHKYEIRLYQNKVVFSSVKKIIDINSILSLFIGTCITAELDVTDIKINNMFDN